MHKRSAFTLIELLVVIAIIAILSIVVVLTLNPAESLRQTRDSNRLSDLSVLSSAIAQYQTDQSIISSSGAMGTSSVIYVSLPDTNASTSIGSNCSSLNLPTLPTDIPTTVQDPVSIGKQMEQAGFLLISQVLRPVLP